MRIPNVAHIGPAAYNVLWDPDIASEDGVVGLLNRRKRTISLDEGSCLSLQEQTFIHECIEAMNYEFNIDLDHHQICLLESCFFSFLRDNYGKELEIV